MFQNPRSWEAWEEYFRRLGYQCLAPAWPLHAGEPADLRTNPPAGLGDLQLETLVREFSEMAGRQNPKPILIGHSLGGLIAQRLVGRDLAAAAVCISSVAPNDMVALDWGFLNNSAAITNPFKGDAPYEMTPERFHAAFANTMSRAASDEAHRRFAVHESRCVLRDALGKAGRVDTRPPHAPLLFIGGTEDQIIPPRLNQRNAEAYTDDSSTSDFREFSGRGHYICGEPGWEDVAACVADWLERQALDPLFAEWDDPHAAARRWA